MVSNQLTKSGWGRRPHYGNWELSNAERASLPPNIKCRRCEKVKPTRFFSNKQLKELADHCDTFQRIKGKTYDARSAAHINCETCSGQPAVELECYRCGAWKVLDAFTREQRRNGDEAKCQACMREITSLEPTDYDEASSDEDDDDDDSDGSDGLGPAAGTVYTTTNSMRDMSITGSSIAASTSSQSGGVSLDGGSHHGGYVTADDGFSETSTIGPMTTRREYGGAFNMARNHANASGSSGDGAFPKMRSVPPHLRVAKDFELRRQHELAAAAKAKAQRNGAEPDDLDDVEVESSEEESD